MVSFHVRFNLAVEALDKPRKPFIVLTKYMGTNENGMVWFQPIKSFETNPSGEPFVK
jgi:hypothetical protein